MLLRRTTVARLSFTFQYKPFMWCRLDARLRHDYLFVYLSRRCSRHPIGLQLFVGNFGRTTARLPFYLSCHANINYLNEHCYFAHDAFMHAFVISYVRTVLRVLSKYSPGLLIWPDVDEGDLMNEELDSESDA